MTIDPKAAPKGTDKFMRQGHTANQFGQDPAVTPMGKAGDPPRELKGN